MNLPQLRATAQQNKIVGRSVMNKPELIALLTERGLLSGESTKLPGESMKALRGKKSDHPCYAHLKQIRRNPKRAIIEDVNTGEISEYSSLYKAGKAIGVNSKRLIANADKIMNNKYKITIQAN